MALVIMKLKTTVQATSAAYSMRNGCCSGSPPPGAPGVEGETAPSEAAEDAVAAPPSETDASGGGGGEEWEETKAAAAAAAAALATAPPSILPA